ncbi:MAG: pilin [Candidatus Woesebacteria bacterium]|nr:pilin [Candidatus Woesebacteria bacterium]
MKKILIILLSIFFFSFSLISSKTVFAQNCIAPGGVCHPTIPCCNSNVCVSGFCQTQPVTTDCSNFGGCYPNSYTCEANHSPSDCPTGYKCGTHCSPSTNPSAPVTDTGKDSQRGIWCDGNEGTLRTAIGCIPVFDQTSFLSTLLTWAVGIGGGIAFLLILYAGFMVMTSAGNPERLKAGQELLTSAISGLILLVFSVFILRFVGIDILGLDKFGFGK